MFHYFMKKADEQRKYSNWHFQDRKKFKNKKKYLQLFLSN